MDKVIRFGEIDEGKLTVGDMLLIEDTQTGKYPFHNMTELMAGHMVNEDGSDMPNDAALKLLKSLSLNDFKKVSEAFREAIQRKAIPPVRSEG